MYTWILFYCTSTKTKVLSYIIDKLKWNRFCNSKESFIYQEIYNKFDVLKNIDNLSVADSN